MGRSVCICGDKSDKILFFSNPKIIKDILLQPRCGHPWHSVCVGYNMVYIGTYPTI
jgi:hypothetical protein